MSYCVNCGVELDDSAEKCALCGVPVINPLAGEKSQEIYPPFSEEEHIPNGIKRRFIAAVISVVILIPNIVCFIANAISRDSGFWSIFVNATSALVWAVFVFPFFTKKLRPYLMWAFDTFAICVYIYLFFALGYERQVAGWYYKCALPMVLSLSVLVLVYMVWCRRKKRSWLLKSIMVISDIAILGLVFGSVFDFSTSLKHAFEIGMIIFVSCVVMMAFLLYCYLSKSMRKWLERKFFT